jgi:hypothetical protein
MGALHNRLFTPPLCLHIAITALPQEETKIIRLLWPHFWVPPYTESKHRMVGQNIRVSH